MATKPNPAPAAQSTPAVFSANRDHGLHDACMDAHRETANALYDTRARLAACVEALREMDANCENRQDEPFVKYVRSTCRAALAQAKGGE